MEPDHYSALCAFAIAVAVGIYAGDKYNEWKEGPSPESYAPIQGAAVPGIDAYSMDDNLHCQHLKQLINNRARGDQLPYYVAEIEMDVRAIIKPSGKACNFSSSLSARR